jgi:hypothetical protein
MDESTYMKELVKKLREQCGQVSYHLKLIEQKFTLL